MITILHTITTNTYSTNIITIQHISTSNVHTYYKCFTNNNIWTYCYYISFPPTPLLTSPPRVNIQLLILLIIEDTEALCSG